MSSAQLEKQDTVLEIGAGTGLLTESLAEAAGRVVAVEIEKNFLEALHKKFAEMPRVKIIEGDFLKMPIEKILHDDDKILHDVKVVANIPYSITAPILAKLMEYSHVIHTIVLTVQREVADRLCAKPRTKAYGSLTLFAHYYCTSEKLFTISPSCFFPKPEVVSACVRLRVRKEKPAAVKDEDFFFRVVSCAFQQRRKTLKNALQALPSEKEATARALRACALPQNARAEELTLEQFAKLASVLKA